MKAAQFRTLGGNLEVVQVPIPNPAAGQVRIKVKACGICHSDVATKYGAIVPSFPRTPGHEVVGTVDQLGEGVKDFKVGDYVGVGWFGGNCGHCLPCKKGVWISCENLQVPGNHYDGGYAEYMVAPTSALARIPKDLTAVEAGPLMCAGLTTFNSIRNSGCIPGDIVVIQGLGGLGHLGVQFASKFGFYTVVVSRGADKEPLAKKLGAHLYIDAEKQDAVKEIQALGGAKLILATAPSAKATEELIPALGLHGKLLIVAIIQEPLKVNTVGLVLKIQSIQAWASGDSRDTEDTIRFAGYSGVRPMVEVFPLDKAPEAFDHMLSNKARFRVVLKISD